MPEVSHFLDHPCTYL